jgi:hypothetical protein
VPSHPLWEEVMMVVTEFGGNLETLVNDALDRICACVTDPTTIEQDGSSSPWPETAAACSTGPP